MRQQPRQQAAKSPITPSQPPPPRQARTAHQLGCDHRAEGEPLLRGDGAGLGARGDHHRVAAGHLLDGAAQPAALRHGAGCCRAWAGPAAAGGGRCGQVGGRRERRRRVGRPAAGVPGASSGLRSRCRHRSGSGPATGRRGAASTRRGSRSSSRATSVSLLQHPTAHSKMRCSRGRHRERLRTADRSQRHVQS